MRYFGKLKNIINKKPPKTVKVIICSNWIRKLVTLDKFLCGIFPDSEFIGGQLLGYFAL